MQNKMLLAAAIGAALSLSPAYAQQDYEDQQNQQSNVQSQQQGQQNQQAQGQQGQSQQGQQQAQQGGQQQGTLLIVMEDWDTDASGDVSREEWNTGMRNQGMFDEWDSDSDGLLTEDEFNEGLAAGGDYDYQGWDSDNDGLLSQDETSEGLYDTYDENGDQRIDEPEFGDFGDDVGDEGLFDV